MHVHRPGCGCAPVALGRRGLLAGAAAAGLLAAASRRYPEITWIFSHGGGVLTSVAERFDILPRLRPG